MTTTIVFKTTISIFLLCLVSCASLTTVQEPHETNEEEQALVEITGDVIVNLEGKITEVSTDGKNFKLENGPWIITDDQTKLGISGPNALPKEDQYFEPTFRVGNSIAGFSETPDGEIIFAQVIYTNWNWEDPIKNKS